MSVPLLASPPEQHSGGIHLFVLEGRREVIQLDRAQSDLRAERDLAPARYHGMHLTQHGQGLRRLCRELVAELGHIVRRDLGPAEHEVLLCAGKRRDARGDRSGTAARGQRGAEDIVEPFLKLRLGNRRGYGQCRRLARTGLRDRA